ncbi:MAG: hypothetical protein A2147_09210 [Chloroflexi bacterium RBG_16_57_8]|nr:MAG: hypothetical protein A2147_09210 [Chloroflexi bacterium RBG_16_57_8]
MGASKSQNVAAGAVRSRDGIRRDWLKWLAVLPLAIAVVALISLTRVSSTSVFHIPNFPGQYFNIVLLGGASFLLAYLAWRGFAASGQVQLALFGGGALSLGMATALGAIVFLLSDQINVTSAIHTTGVLLSSILFLAGAIVELGGGALFRSPKQGRWLALGTNAVVLLLLFSLTAGSGFVYYPPSLFSVFNIVFVVLTSSVVAYLAARGFAATGQPQLAWLGAGAMVFAFSGLLNALAQTRLNVSVTVHNTGALLAALLYVASAVVTLRGGRSLLLQARSKAATLTVT